MNFTGKKAGKQTNINITPLLDVMFLLVIFVLLAAKFEPAGGVAVNLPTGQSREAAQVETKVLSLTAGGGLFWQKEKITFAELPARIAALKEQAADPVVVINADENVDYGRVARATDIISQSGVRKFNLRLQP